MENPNDIKKPEEETAEILEETVGDVKKEANENAEGYKDQFNGNDEKIEKNLEGNGSPEAEKIRREEKSVLDEAGEKISGFENEVINTTEQQLINKIITQYNETETTIIFGSSVNLMEGNLKILKEKISEAKAGNIDLSSIPDLDERIKDFEKKIEEKRVMEKKDGGTEWQTEKSFVEHSEENNELNLSNDDLKFFIDELKRKGLENSEIFSFAKNKLQEREKRGVDFEPIKKLPENREKNEEDKKKNIEEISKYSDEELIFLIKNSIEMSEEAIKKEITVATETPEILMIEEKIKEAKKRKINMKIINEFEKKFKNISEKAYLATVMGSLNKAGELADEFKKNEDINYKEAAVMWIFNARETENKYKENINKFDLEKIDEKIKNICAIVGLDENDMTREEFQKGEEDHQRLLAIHEEIMGKMKLRENILSSKKIEAELRTKPDKPKSEPEPEPKTETHETEETAEDIENEELADEIEAEINEEKLDKETKERLRKWDNEKNKDQKIGEKKGNIKEKLGDRLMEREREKAEEIERAKERGEVVETEEGARIINRENVKKILESRDELDALRNEIGKEAEDGIKERKRIAEEIKGSIDPNNPELAKLNIGEKMMAKEAVFRFLKTTKDILSLNEIDYLLEAENIDFGDLPQTHEKREIEMEELQATIDAIEEYKKFMERFEIMTEEQQEEVEEAREELGRFVRWLNWVKENKKDLFLILVAIGVVAGVAAFISTIGLPAGISAPAYLTAENAIKAGVGLAALGTAGYVVKKKKVQAVLKTAGMAIGLPIVGAALVVDLIFSGEKWDERMKKFCGVSVPEWARSKNDKK